MSRNWKIAIVVIVSSLFICVLLCGLVFVVFPFMMARNITSQSPAQAKQVATQIADYTLPPGYSEQFAIDMFFEKIVTLAPTNRRGMMISLLQMPPTTNRQQMQQQMNQQLQNQFQFATGTMSYVGTHDVTIKGETVALNVTESNSASFMFRQASGFFDGKGGLVMMMIQGETATWDWALVENFCASIK